MKDDELKAVVEKLNNSNQKDEAVFGVFQYGGGPDESFIKANKSGLQIFAAEILKASLESKSIIEDKEKSIIPLDYNSDWVDENSDVFLQYIEPIGGTRQNSLPIVINKYARIKEDIFKVGCAIIAIFLFACVCLGLGKMWTIIFN